MSILKINKYGDQILKKQCKPVEKITSEIKQLINDMFETLYAAPGIGLAANQVGVLLQICVIDLRIDNKKRPLVLINPRIVSQKDKIDGEEGCLSLPGLSAKVKRYNYVTVEAINDKGFPIVVQGEGLSSRVLQHEIDHLKGKVYLDYLSFGNRKKLENEIKERKKRGEW